MFALLFTVLGVSASQESGDALAGGAFGVLFGVSSIVLFPTICRLLGFVGGLISALLYNLNARFVRGIEPAFDQESSRVY